MMIMAKSTRTGWSYKKQFDLDLHCLHRIYPSGRYIILTFYGPELKHSMHWFPVGLCEYRFQIAQDPSQTTWNKEFTFTLPKICTLMILSCFPHFKWTVFIFWRQNLNAKLYFLPKVDNLKKISLNFKPYFLICHILPIALKVNS